MISPRVDAARLPLDLGDGLVLRRSTASDADALAEFNARLHSDEGPDKPDERLRAWTHDLLAKPHPTFSVNEFTIIEQAGTGKIISSLNLISQQWAYAGIPFKVGRPELVGTLPEYRNRGLVRIQFDVIHQWSAQKGEMLQAITGIPYYYRMFGYEMAMNLGGGRAGYPTHIPRLKEGETEPYHIRPAGEADIPFISELYVAGCRRSLVACTWDEALFRYELTGKSKHNINRAEIRIIETAEGTACGFFIHPDHSWGDMMPLQLIEILPHLSWLEVTPTVIRYLETYYQQVPPGQGEKKPFGAFGFWLGEEHPVYHAFSDSLPRLRKPYAWYLRLEDIPGFLRLITPVLEQRLAASSLANYTGEVKITFYRGGLRLVFERGRMVTSEAWQPTPTGNSGNAAFPPHTFLQLVFGYRSMDMLKSCFADCWTDRDAVHTLLDSLFPRQPSDVWPVS